jgi:hypothetical protein
MPTTGNAGSITFGTSAIVLSWTRIGEWQATRDKLAIDHLATTGFRPYMPNDLAEPGEVEVEAYFKPDTALASIGSAAAEVIITYPKTGGAAAATLTGTAFLTMVSLPELVNGTVAKQKLRVAFDGNQGPTFVAQA